MWTVFVCIYQGDVIKKSPSSSKCVMVSLLSEGIMTHSNG